MIKRSMSLVMLSALLVCGFVRPYQDPPHSCAVGVSASCR
jgi:hypothetical protein